jgi:hypothetical protein
MVKLGERPPRSPTEMSAEREAFRRKPTYRTALEVSCSVEWYLSTLEAAGCRREETGILEVDREECCD